MKQMGIEAENYANVFELIMLEVLWDDNLLSSVEPSNEKKCTNVHRDELSTPIKGCRRFPLAPSVAG